MPSFGPASAMNLSVLWKGRELAKKEGNYRTQLYPSDGSKPSDG